MRRSHFISQGIGGATTRRGFLRACGTAAFGFAAAATFFPPVRKASAADPIWDPIPAQVWEIGVPVYLNLADYCASPDGEPILFELDQPLPPGLALNGSVISGVPREPLPATDFVAVADDQANVTGASSDGPPPPARLHLVASPNPSSGAVRILGERRTTVESVGMLRVFSVSGRLVYERVVPVTGNRYEVRWDGRTADGAKLPSGVYVVTVRTGAETAGTRLVLAQ